MEGDSSEGGGVVADFQNVGRFGLLARRRSFLSTVRLSSCKSLGGSAPRDAKNQEQGSGEGPETGGWLKLCELSS